MTKGQSFHLYLIRDALNNKAPQELSHLIKPWHISKWNENKPVFYRGRVLY